MPPQPHELSNMRTLRNVGRENRLAELATRQYGVVSIAQLHELGWTTSAISGRLAAGKLHRRHRGVYAVGHRRLSKRGRWMAAALACGPDAVLSHRSAAELCGLLPRSPWFAEVSSPRRARRRPGVVVHVVTSLTACDRTVVEEIPCARIALTLLGVAEVDPGSLGAAIAAAERQRLLDRHELDRLLGVNRGRPGVAALRVALARTRVEDEWSRSELERRFLRLCSQAGLPRPRVNAWVEVPGDGFEVDFCWPAARLIVEVDGYRSHGDRAAFELDRRRDQLLTAAGWTVIRFTWRQLTREPRRVASTLADLLSAVPGLYDLRQREVS